MVVNSVVERFAKLGFSEYEAKAYCALLQTHPATAYEAARESGIPTSKIYEVLERLLSRSLVLVIEQDGKKRYAPQPIEEFVESTRQRLDSTLDELKSDLQRVGARQDVSYVWNLGLYDSVLDKALRMAENARNTLLVSAWGPEAHALAAAVATAHERGVKTAVVLFGQADLKLPNVFFHPIEETIYQEKGGRGLVVVADGQEALMGTIHEDEAVEGAWSLGRAFVTLAEDYVKHDIYIMKIVGRFDADLQRRFGGQYALLRDVFSDQEV